MTSWQITQVGSPTNAHPSSRDLRSRGIDVRVVAETVARDEAAYEERAAEGTHETLGSLVQRFHDHIMAILVHRVQVIEDVQREQGHRIVGVESAVTDLSKRIVELERDNKRLRGTASVEVISRHPKISPSVMLLCCRNMPNTQSGASMTHEEVEELVSSRVAKEMEARKAAMNLEPLNESEDEHEGENGGNGNGGNRENRNGNGGNEN
nr:hypothetical protein [Tanacetum cinerariifolium]